MTAGKVSSNASLLINLTNVLKGVREMSLNYIPDVDLYLAGRSGIIILLQYRFKTLLQNEGELR